MIGVDVPVANSTDNITKKKIDTCEKPQENTTFVRTCKFIMKDNGTELVPHILGA